MKLYIAKPSEKWAYCGGGLVAIAASSEDLMDLLKSNKDTEEVVIYDSEDDVSNNDELYKWVIVEVLEVGDRERKVVLFDYNWG